MNDIKHFNEEYLKAAKLGSKLGYLSNINVDEAQSMALANLNEAQINALTKSSLCVATPSISSWMLSETQSHNPNKSDYSAEVYDLNYLYLSTAKYVCAKNPKLATLTMGLDFDVACKMALLTKKDIKRIATSRPLLFKLSIPSLTLRGVARLPGHATRNLHLIPMLSNHHYARAQ